MRSNDNKSVQRPQKRRKKVTAEIFETQRRSRDTRRAELIEAIDSEQRHQVSVSYKEAKLQEEQQPVTVSETTHIEQHEQRKDVTCSF